MLQIKPGVKLIGLGPQILLAINIAHSLWHKKWPRVPLTITCATDGKHGTGSRHFFGNAVDIRTRDLPGGSKGESAKDARNELQAALSGEFDVVYESTHIHIEWDPKHGS